MDPVATHVPEIEHELETFLSILAEDATSDAINVRKAYGGEDLNDSPDCSENGDITSVLSDAAHDLHHEVLLQNVESLENARSQLEHENCALKDQLCVLQDKVNDLEGTLSRVTWEMNELESNFRSQALEVAESRRDASRLRRAHAIIIANKDNELTAERAELGSANLATKEAEFKIRHLIRLVNEERAKSNGLEIELQQVSAQTDKHVADLGNAGAMVSKLKEEKNSLYRSNVDLSIFTVMALVYWIYFS
ncbi:hypothetical protein WG66_006670 [Moniliophthora roreri]|uniref:Uncharacterized protein n=1 Tax=Moniliophthora roreri TaxID=221103 RepID=A0A0W0ETA9_MONRR|nr:hypothetical protein WG66_006670 [Moniliophthora roreri]